MWCNSTVLVLSRRNRFLQYNQNNSLEGYHTIWEDKQILYTCIFILEIKVSGENSKSYLMRNTIIRCTVWESFENSEYDFHLEHKQGFIYSQRGGLKIIELGWTMIPVTSSLWSTRMSCDVSYSINHVTNFKLCHMERIPRWNRTLVRYKNSFWSQSLKPRLCSSTRKK